MSRPSPSAGGRDLGGVALILAAAAFFATLGPLSVFAGRAGVSSLTLVTWRAAIGASCVLLLVGTRHVVGRGSGLVGIGDIPVRERWFVGAAAIANTILNLSVFIAFGRIGVTLSLLVFYLYPAFVALVSVAWLGDRLDRIRWGALAMSMVGIVLVVAGAGSFGELDALGLGLALVGALGQTFYVIAARHGFARIPGTQAAIVTMAGAASIYLVIATLFVGAGTLLQPLAGFDAAWPVLLAGMLGAGAPTVLYITGIRRLGPPRAAILATLEPVIGVALAALLLGERPSYVQLLGGLLIIGAGIVLQLRPHADIGGHEAVEDVPEPIRP